MAPNPNRLQAFVWEAESSFGETDTTYANRLQYVSVIDVKGLTHEKVPIEPVVQRLNDGVHDFRGIMGGEITIEIDLTGRGSTSAGAVSKSDLAEFIGYCLGASSVAASSGTTLDGAGTTTTLDLAAASADFADGSLVRVGALGDERGEGQFYAVADDTADTITLLNAMQQAGQAADVVYAPDMVYTNEEVASNEITGIRFACISGNQQFSGHGAFCTAFELTGLNPGERPRIRATLQVAWWANTGPSFPSAVAVGNAGAPTPVAGGSFAYADVASTTRNTQIIRAFSLAFDLQVTPLLAPSAAMAHQAVVGAVRTKCMATFEFLVDGDDFDWDTWWNTDEASIAFRHIMYTLSTRDGAALGMYFPKVAPMGMRPMQEDNNGVNARMVSCKALTGPTVTTELEASSWRLALA